MTIKSDLLAALTPVLANTWAVELPEQFTLPAIVFDVVSQAENVWTYGADYDQHTVSVTILAKTLAELPALQASVDTALMAMSGYLFDEERGDATYEDDASIYGFFSNHVIRYRT
jgi:hypothetical protein